MAIRAPAPPAAPALAAPAPTESRLHRAVLPVVFVLFFTSGFAALLYQVIWQRVLAIFSGADVYAVTIIVTAFMAGLGCGSLAGGYLADRLSARRRIILFALAESAIGGFALLSTGLYYDVLYGQWGALAKSPPLLALVLFLSLLWPTFFMGLSLPLLARALTRQVAGAARTVGALYACNTAGAAVGAFAATWFFSRLIGFEPTVQVGAVLNFAAALGALAIAPLMLRGTTAPAADVEEPPTHTEDDPTIRRFPVGGWIAIYALSGFVALALEILWFRLLGVMLKSTAWTFGSLLSIYLTGLAVGTFAGIVGAGRSRRPARLFLLGQAGITLYAGLALALISGALMNHLPLLEPLWTYLGLYTMIDVGAATAAIGDGLLGRPVAPESAALIGPFVQLYGLLPAALLGVPTLLMGFSYPVLQKVVQRDLATLGRRVGWLQTANIFGSMLGALGTGWLLLALLSTAWTLRALVVVGGGFLLLALLTRAGGSRAGRGRSVLLAGAVTVGIMAAIPNAKLLWATMHGSPPDRILTAEDSTGLAALRNTRPDFSDTTVVFAGGVGQSSLPYGTAHTELGMIPVMVHPAPRRVAVIGLGSGDTLFSAGGREETEELTVIEIVASEVPVLRQLQAIRPYGGLQSLFEDRRIRWAFTDGRAFIKLGDTKYDMIEADALRPTMAYAGTLYSYEYFLMLRDHLAPGGIAASWVPTPRTNETFIKAFPYVVYSPPGLMLGSNEPITWDMAAIRARLTTPFTRAYYARAGLNVDDYVQTFTGYGPPTFVFTPEFDRNTLTNVNRDLFPKDEYLVP